ncbi:MAG: methyl-accepting chemotaxis protein [Candidatus Saccharibacteria bacterium]
MNDSRQQVAKLIRQYKYVTPVFTMFGNIPWALLLCWWAGITGEYRIYTILTGMAGGIVIAALVIPLNLKRFFKPIYIMLDNVINIANGDLREDLEKYDFDHLNFMKDALNRMVFETRRLVLLVSVINGNAETSSTTLRKEAENTSMAANEIARAVVEVANANGEQDQALQLIIEETDQISTIAERITAQAKALVTNLDDSKVVVNDGVGMVEQQKQQMLTNRNIINEINSAIFDLSGKSQQIGEIMQAISEIAAQTNLLALNASIEAARSGERGRGFQVVAQQVRKLAEESARAAVETGSLTESIKNSIHQVVFETRIAEQTVLDQEAAIGESQTVINQVMDDIKVIIEDINRLSFGIEEIDSAINRIETTVRDTSAVTSQNTQSSREIAQTADEQAHLMEKLKEGSDSLGDLVQELKEQVAKFKLPPDFDWTKKIDSNPVSDDDLKHISKVYRKKTIILSGIAAMIIFTPLLYLVNGFPWVVWPVLLKTTVIAFTSGATAALLSATKNIKGFIMPMGTIAKFADAISQGNLSQQIGPEYKMGSIEVIRDEFNNLIQQLNIISQKVKDCCVRLHDEAGDAQGLGNETAVTARQMATSINEIAQGATFQAQGMMEASEQVNELFSSLKNIEDSTSVLSAHSVEAAEVVDKGVSNTTVLKTKAEQNMGAVNRVAAAVRDLEDKSTAIGQIVQVITNIATDTNLLALNAAIEAARAGEEGRGFAVVASEVKKLAEETLSAAEKIYELIGDIQNGTEKVVSDMESARKSLETLVQAVFTSQKVMEQVAERLGPIRKETRIIIDDCQVMNTSTSRIAGSIQSIAAGSQETAAAAEEVLASTEEQERSVLGVNQNLEQFANLTNKLYRRLLNLKVS